MTTKLDQAADGIADLTNKAANGTKKLADEAQDKASHLFEDARHRVIDAKDASARFFGNGQEQLARTIKHHPFIAVGIGLGLGYLVARLVHRD